MLMDIKSIWMIILMFYMLGMELMIIVFQLLSELKILCFLEKIFHYMKNFLQIIMSKI